ncbi:MAG: SDR family NAD(P)-dependent oxidoreductase [Erysipelotrichaceae bacterium]|nr:SDR family NAD(P)-dependent oxidoreductase [Erysipelotrichaceae bacterium]MDD3810542.1 SDR family NAD(P)-dependent oxidoreductase [Erysipelotrichaceae bacterium]
MKMENMTEMADFDKSKGIVVVTGCDSGIGKSLVEQLQRQGRQLVVTYLEENHFATMKNVQAIRLDLTDDQETQRFEDYLRQLIGDGYQVDTVITNSGVALGGPIEDIPMDLYYKTFSINFFGAIRVIKAVLPSIISTQGTVLVNGSMAGKVAMPFLSPYASSKFALEGFCDSLRREMNPFGVKTILLEPAAVATPIWNKALKQDISYVQEKYMASLQSFKKNFIEGGNSGMDVDLAAQEIIAIMAKKKPQDRYIIASNKLTSKLTTFVPQSYIDKVVVKMFDMYYGKNKK